MPPPDIKIDAPPSPRPPPVGASFARALSPGQPFPGTLSPEASPLQSPTSTLGLKKHRSVSEVSLLEKPLPSPNTWGRVSISTSRQKHAARRFLRSAWWMPPSGWRSTVLAGAGLAVAILIINIVIMAWSLTKPFDENTKTRTLWQGDCDATHSTFTGTHLVINICSTLLLGTSNAAMQCLSAPTRAAVDRAHAKGHWLDIGISGFRNWTSMERWRQWLWILLIVSTVPLHLLYNSVIFQTTTANEYFALVVSSDFRDRGLTNGTIGPGADSQWQQPPPADLLTELTTLAQKGELQRQENVDCLNTYNNQLVSTFSNVLLVTKERTDNTTSRWFRHYPTPEANGSGSQTASVATWICGWGDDSNANCDIDGQIGRASSWNYTLSPDPRSQQVFIDHCMVQTTSPKCTVQLIPEIMGTVVVCNIIKVVCFIFAAYARGFQPLITLGDALASFLKEPDPTTRDLGPLSAGEIRDAEDRIRLDLIQGRKTDDVPLHLGPWQSLRRRWFTGASRLRWGLTYVMLVGLWTLGLIFLIIASISSKATYAAQWKIGFGNVATQLLLTFTSRLGVLGNILVANAPQLLLSLIYLSYNGLFTCILISHEFSAYARQRAPLRVTSPEGLQRGTYFLSLPYRFAIPLLALSGLLHWALSQSIFLAEVKAFNPNGAFDADYSVSCLGYSSLGLLITMLLGTIMVVTPLILCWRRYRSGSPLLESNSLAMSAACQLDQGCDNAVVKYGARGDQVGLSAGSVEPLVSGKRYTPLAELDLQPYVITSVRKTLSRRQKILLGIAAFFNLAKLGLVWFASAGTPIGSYGGFVAIDVIMPLTIIYVFTRLVTGIHRVRKKRIIRRFGWHVAPEILFTIMYVTLMATTVYYEQRNVAQETPKVEYSASSEYARVERMYFTIQILYAVIWIASVAVEVCMWMDQLRWSIASLPNMRPRRIGRVSKAEA